MALTGDHVTLTSYYPAITAQDWLFTGTAVAVNGMTFTNANLTVNPHPAEAGSIIVPPTVSFGPSTITIQYSAADNNKQFASGGFNGLDFGTAATDQAIGEVSIVQTNLQGLTDADITATAHSIDINVQNARFPATGNGVIELVASFGPPFYEVNNQGQTIRWANPQNVTISDLGLPQQYRYLVGEAETYWEHYANIHFNDVTNTPQAANADIQVNVEQFHPLTSHVLGDTPIGFIGNNIGLPVHVSIENPNELAVTALADGDFRYQGTDNTMFQTIVHELGHALGLAHNTVDPNSVMWPIGTANDQRIDNNDVAAIQGLYGAPTNPPDLPALVTLGGSGF